ncbi:MAG: hypothetical protein ACI9GM_000570 [Salibacteraceae bacterium]|jgi:hypothetical protein
MHKEKQSEMIAFNTNNLRHFKLNTEAERWNKSKVITNEQLEQIELAHPISFYHPPAWLRIILSIAVTLGVLALWGFFVISVLGGIGDSESIIPILLAFTGVLCIALLEYLIQSNNHYKSGVTEALMFIGFSFLIMGFVGFDSSEYAYSFAILIVGLIMFLRYSNLFGSLIALGGLSFIVFMILYELGPMIQGFLPIVFFAFFTGLYFLRQSLQDSIKWYYTECVLVLDSSLLILIYLSMNYYVVRELSAELMHLRIEPGEDIPFAFLFYAFTVLVPIGYLTHGILKKKILFIRIGVLLLFASVITYKIYYSSGHPEITLTIVGILITSVTIWLINKLKQPVNGFTREQLLTQEGLNAHTESIIISTTMGGNSNDQLIENDPGMGGGEFGGGGAGGEF